MKTIAIALLSTLLVSVTSFAGETCELVTVLDKSSGEPTQVLICKKDESEKEEEKEEKRQCTTEEKCGYVTDVDGEPVYVCRNVETCD